MNFFTIAGTVFGISLDVPWQSVRHDPAYTDFYCNDQPVDVFIKVHFDGIPPLEVGEEDLLFDSGYLWKLYRRGGKHVITLTSPVFGPQPYRAAVFDEAFSRGDIFCEKPHPDGELLPDPLEYPMVEIVAVQRLGMQGGVIMHACGVVDKGNGYLFCGNSTHGKSTMAGLWREEAVILNDDRIILRMAGSAVWMYGTPWHGTFSAVSARGARLDRLFILRKGPQNRIVPLPPASAASMLMARCFPPFSSRDGMDFTLDFLGRLVTKVPCFELEVLPDKRIVDFVRCVP